jgi:hypothetical protein
MTDDILGFKLIRLIQKRKTKEKTIILFSERPRTGFPKMSL